ncbi:outer membrane protein [Legionella bononiensis]|uniref:Outer membrane beta-barrel protein n=1 Tax=Legionella bononiensis TaxID=2793102 RepID=A0ABS1WC12_9GAMM|nr:outer membrane beta-barrel protein [Legionella bononiensis]MBL7481187.1 outer membrane beta-barrel protein [Legionella bononiensis]MBL7526896.1 outer membrane beta-barrel protein [Legionella bononiensis]MBL7563810.1 outer membrane beta-barrel protein [Legionella bononiensis]
MKKTWTILSLSLALYGTHSFAGTGGAVFEEPSGWTGFYIGANAGYLWSASNVIRNLGIASYENPAFNPFSRLMSESIAYLGTHEIYNSLDSFIGGGQIGYNAQILDKLVIGIDADLDAISPTSSTTNFISTATTPLMVGVTHTANISLTKKLDYLGLVKGRLGYLLNPNVLVYGAGAFAYGGATLNTTYEVTNTQANFTPMSGYASIHDVLGGWAGGGGAEWLITPCWSVKAEYIYYNLGPTHSYLTLTQNVALNPPEAFAAASVKSKAEFTGNVLRVGVNYHFG